MGESRLGRLREDLGAMVEELVASRELLVALARRDLLIRYKQAILGIAWAVFSPLLHMVIFTVVFTRVVPLETGLPYPIYAYAGLLPWTFFATSLRQATISLSANPALVTKVRFARETMPLSAILVAFVDFLVACSILVVMMIVYRIPVGWPLLALPAILAVQIAFTMGLALFLSMANLFWRDVRPLADVLLMVWMFSTSVVYPVDRAGGTLGRILALNPMTPIIDSYRDALLRGQWPELVPFAYAAVVALTVLFAAAVTFHRAEPAFAENT